ncbi:MAG: leucine--tRNA ligase [Candidatus Campbellbacteria bacterium]|nr:leucine--tRNA ligase [Candidatus Campbellbacteria bacterium]
MTKYDHKDIEEKWQKFWAKQDLYKAVDNSDKEKYYILDMFPYPSGSGLHVGHVESYTATDIYSRFKRMQGYNVLHPMGWDAFGLPAENYAVKTGVPPQETTDKSTDVFREQIKSLGLSYDWSREINTSSPEYYKWTQWLFLLLYKNKLAYKKKATVNWCPGCQTVLANEQVVDGECERCDSAVEKKELSQWFFNILKYADELIDGLDTVDWPESTKLAQKNWIGKSEGAIFRFPLNKKFRYVILHGYASGPEKHFLPWLRRKLEEQGHSVEIPTLPNSDDPNIEEQVKYVNENVNLDEDTILLGHSLGTVVALKYLENSNSKIHELVLFGGFIDTDINVDRDFFETFDWKFDFENIKDKSRSIKIVRDESDDSIPPEQAEKIERRIGGEIIDVQARKPHFRDSEEPEVLRTSLPSIEVFTTRPDTLFGATYMIVSPENSLVEKYAKYIENIDEVRSYVESAKAKTDIERSSEEREKTGVELKGLKAINEATKEELPVFVADYVLNTYATGSIMAVPAHDERDHQFAEKMNLPIVEVVSGEGDLPRSEPGVLINSGEFDGFSNAEARSKITEAFGGEIKTTYKLRDWLVSRQRYWGAPIPIVYDPEGNPHPIPEKYLPWELPTDVDYQPKGTAPLGSSEELKKRTEEIFGEGWTPEIDTMDTFVDSSWYYMRFTDPQNADEFANSEKLDSWLPVDMYIGGAEHTVLHLLYARFFTKVLRDLGYLGIDEPFQSLRHQGMILGPDGNKMSKSKGNIVNPDEMMERFGADTVRMYEMFMGPLEQAKAWSTDNMIGLRRFLEKSWRLQEKVTEKSETAGSIVARTIKKVTEDIENLQFNTAISALMILANDFDKKEKILEADFEAYLRLLAPFAPHITEEMYQNLGYKTSVHSTKWPEFKEEDLSLDELTLAVQVDGKVRDSITVPSEANEEEIKQMARTEKVEKWIDGREVKKIIVIPGKIVSIVL